MRTPIRYLWTFALALIILFAPAAAGLAQETSDESMRKAITEARELIYRGDYDGAAGRFDEMAKKRPADPTGDFYHAVALTWKSYVDAKLERGNRRFDADIETSLASAIEKAEAVLARSTKSKKDESDALYYLVSAYAIRSRINLYQNHALPAAKYARTAQNHFEELIKIAPDNADIYFAPGGIYYQVGLLTDTSIGRVATAMLGAKALPTGDREKGLEYLKTAHERGSLTSADAGLALLEIYILKESRFDEAIAIALKLKDKYPDNQTFARYLLMSYAGKKDRAQVNKTARDILARVKQGKPNFGTYMQAEAQRALNDARTW